MYIYILFLQLFKVGCSPPLVGNGSGVAMGVVMERAESDGETGMRALGERVEEGRSQSGGEVESGSA